MRKSLKITMTALAVALTCGFVNEAKAAEGDLVVVNINYIVQNEFKLGFENTSDYDKIGYKFSGFASSNSHEQKIWVGAIYTPKSGWAEMALPSLNASNPTYRQVVTEMTDTGFPNIIEVRFTPHPLGGVASRFVYFRVKADSSIIMWGGDGTGGDDPYGEGSAWAPPATASLGGSGAMSMCCGTGHIYFGAGLVGSAGSSSDSGGGTDLSGVDAALAAIEAKLDSLPAGPQGPAGDAGPTGDAGADGATGADGANAPCVDCVDVQDAVEELACALAPALQLTNVDDLLASVQSLAVNALLGADVCPNGAGEEAACLATIIDGVQALWDSKQ
jgi:hypothetical protein